MDEYLPGVVSMFDNFRKFWSRRDEPSSRENAEARRQAALFRLSAELAAAHDETEVCQRVVAYRKLAQGL